MVGSEYIHDAAAERKFRTNNGQIDLLALRDGEEIVRLTGISWNAAGDRRDAGVARRTDDASDSALARQLPRKCMLSGTAADNQDLHACAR